MGIQEYSVGRMPRGRRNLITDVAGVRVGHYTVHQDRQHTGVTVVLPGSGNCYQNQPVAAAYVHNGYGKTMGSIQIQELGVLETPIALTNTLNVGVVADALIEYTLRQCQKDGVACTSINPVVGECNDSQLNCIAHRAVQAEHVWQAIDSAAEDFEEGSVGAGTGTLCYGLKGGIGSASRCFELEGRRFTLGVLVQSNFGSLRDFTVNGRPVGKRISAALSKQTGKAPSEAEQADKGSIMTVLATDLPVTARQLQRIARRAGAGLARSGSYIGHGSGEVMLAFSTANTRSRSGAVFETLSVVREDLLDAAFAAAAEATHEAVLSSMVHAKAARGLDGRVWHSLSEFDWMEKEE